MKRLILATAMLFATTGQAQDGLTVSNVIQVNKAGYPEAPVVQCPQNIKKYDAMLDDLNGLKAKIKKEACQEMEYNVEELSSLLELKRDGFLKLVEKGSAPDKQLSEKEVKALKTYIDEVVTKVASISGLLNNPACFDENEKASTLSFLSSLIGDVSAAVGAVAGPFGAKISIGGQVAASVISSIDQIVQARKTYDFEDREDRNNYLNNLCAYYEFKGDLDKETQPLEYNDRLWDLKENVEALLSKLYESCEECRVVIDDFGQRVGARLSFQVAVPADITDADSLIADEFVFKTKKAEDMTMRDIYNYYFPAKDEENAEADVLDSEPTDKPSSVQTAQRLMTIRTLRAQGWVDQAMDDLLFNDSEALADDSRREIMRVQKEIEGFLVSHEGRKYIGFYTGVLKRDLWRLEQTASMHMNHLMHVFPRDPNFDYQKVTMSASRALHYVFRKDVDFAKIVQEKEYAADIEERVKEVRHELVRMLESVRIDYGILANRCEFFDKSSFDFVTSVDHACRKAQRQLERSEKLFKELLQTSFAVRHGHMLAFVNEKPANYVEDWLASITAVVTMNLDSL